MVKKVHRSKKMGKARSYRKRRVFRSKKANQEHMSNRSDPSRHTVIAERYSTKLYLEHAFTGQSSGSDSGIQYFDINANNAYTPFENVNTISGFQQVTSVNDYAAIGDVGVSALFPNGFYTLLNLYDEHLIRGCKIQVTVIPGLAGTSNPYNGNMKLCIFPWYNTGTTAMENLPAKIDEASAIPYAKTILCTPYNNIAKNTLSNYLTAHKVLGITKQQYEDEQNARYITATGVAYSNAFQGVNWRVLIQNFVPTTATGWCVNVKVTYYVEYLKPVQAFGITT